MVKVTATADAVAVAALFSVTVVPVMAATVVFAGMPVPAPEA